MCWEFLTVVMCYPRSERRGKYRVINRVTGTPLVLAQVITRKAFNCFQPDGELSQQLEKQIERNRPNSTADRFWTINTWGKLTIIFNICSTWENNTCNTCTCSVQTCDHDCYYLKAHDQDLYYLETPSLSHRIWGHLIFRLENRLDHKNAVTSIHFKLEDTWEEHLLFWKNLTSIFKIWEYIPVTFKCPGNTWPFSLKSKNTCKNTWSGPFLSWEHLSITVSPQLTNKFHSRKTFISQIRS